MTLAPLYYRGADIIVLATENRNEGTSLKGVAVYSKHSFHKVGDYSTPWNGTVFTPFTGTVKMEESWEGVEE